MFLQLTLVLLTCLDISQCKCSFYQIDAFFFLFFFSNVNCDDLNRKIREFFKLSLCFPLSFDYSFSLRTFFSPFSIRYNRLNIDKFFDRNMHRSQPKNIFLFQRIIVFNVSPISDSICSRRTVLASFKYRLVIRDRYDEYAQLPIELLCFFFFFYHVKT